MPFPTRLALTWSQRTSVVFDLSGDRHDGRLGNEHFWSPATIPCRCIYAEARGVARYFASQSSSRNEYS